MRLDLYLSQNHPLSRSQIARLIKEGHVLVNGLPAKPSYSVLDSDKVVLNIPAVKPSPLTPHDLPLDILYEDKNLAVINKPAHLVVHPGAGHKEATLTQALLYHFKGLSTIGGVERPGIVHRLDKGTSGVMLVAKNDKTHLKLSELFKNHSIEKTYLALCYGKFKNKKGTIKTGIARSLSNRKKFSVSEKGKIAISHYEVLKEKYGLSLVEVKIETGRTHQIRVHLTHLGHPLVGDETYGSHSRSVKNVNKMWAADLAKINRPLLHAFKIKIPDMKKEFKAAVPKDFKLVQKKLL
ncbi:RluA family pseudouridine synthase [bacterium]|nr:RluA family pseudouridine synthase [bacterium]